MAEGKGFEPPEGVSSFNDLANRRLQPLGHPSAGAKLAWPWSSPANLYKYTAYAALSLSVIALSVKRQYHLFPL